MSAETQRLTRAQRKSPIEAGRGNTKVNVSVGYQHVPFGTRRTHD